MPIPNRNYSNMKALNDAILRLSMIDDNYVKDTISRALPGWTSDDLDRHCFTYYSLVLHGLKEVLLYDDSPVNHILHGLLQVRVLEAKDQL